MYKFYENLQEIKLAHSEDKLTVIRLCRDGTFIIFNKTCTIFVACLLFVDMNKLQSIKAFDMLCLSINWTTVVLGQFCLQTG